MFRSLALAASLTAVSCKSVEPEGATLVPGLSTNSERSIEARPHHSIESPAARPTPEPARPVPSQAPAAAVALQTTLSSIPITLVAFDSRTHRLAIADQDGGPGSRWADAEAAARDLGGIAAVNASFFTPEGKPLGLVVTGDKRISPINRTSSLGAGLFIGGNSPSLQRRELPANSPEVLQSGPFLVENGHAISGLSQDSSTARTVLGWDGGHGWFIARTGACSLAQLGQALAGAEVGGVKARTVLNLDGGRSSDLWVSSAVSGGPVSQRPFWNKPVRNFLVLLPRR